MSAVGVSVKDEVVNQYNNLKLKHTYRFIQLKLTDDLREIEVEKTVESASYNEFVQQLPENDCRYVVYNYQVTIPDGSLRDRLIFIMWCPETSKVKTKMLYTTSKDALRRKLVGINQEVQATKRSDLAEEVVKKLWS